MEPHCVEVEKDKFFNFEISRVFELYRINSAMKEGTFYFRVIQTFYYCNLICLIQRPVYF
jgi:hypothetical protein